MAKVVSVRPTVIEEPDSQDFVFRTDDYIFRASAPVVVSYEDKDVEEGLNEYDDPDDSNDYNDYECDCEFCRGIHTDEEDPEDPEDWNDQEPEDNPTPEPVATVSCLCSTSPNCSDYYEISHIEPAASAPEAAVKSPDPSEIETVAWVERIGFGFDIYIFGRHIAVHHTCSGWKFICEWA